MTAHRPIRTGREAVDHFAAWSREAEFRAARNNPVVRDLEARARAINGGKNLPRPYPPQNGGMS